MSSRRTLALVTALALSAAALGACGGDDSAADAASSTTAAGGSSSSAAPATTAVATTAAKAASTTSAPASKAAFPVTITNRLGEVTIESQPKRIVALGTNDIDVVYGLGLQPVGAAVNTTTGGLAPWLQAEHAADGVTMLTVTPEPSLEAIAALQPDVILASPMATIDQFYAQLNEIAPVVADTAGVLSDSWQDRTRKVGLALGRSDDAEELVEEGEAALADVAARHPGLAGRSYTLSWARSADQIAVMAADDITAHMFAELGMHLPEQVLAMRTNTSGGSGTGAATVTLETVGMLDADIMVVAYNDATSRQQMEANPVLANVPAVLDGRYLAVDIATISALRVPSALAIEWTFAQLDPVFGKVG